MKRHISVFTFLLGVSVMSFDVRAATKPCIITDQTLNFTIQTGDPYTPTKVLGTEKKSRSSDYYYLLFDGGWTSVTAPQRIGKKLDGWYTLDENAEPSDITLAKLSVRLEESDTFAKGKIGSAKTTNWNGTYGVIGPKYSYKELKIEFNGNGATSGSTPTQDGLNYDSNDIVLNPNGFVRTGYTFADWTNRVGRTFSDGATVNGADFWVGDENGSFDSKLYASWTENTYAIGSSGENCMVTVASSAKYTDAVTVSWTPASETGKAFTFASAAVYAGDTKIGDLPSASPATFRMSDLNAYYGSVTVKVIYTGAQTQHTLTVASADSQKGSVSKEPYASEYDYGSPVTIRATANDGYAFEKWSDGSTQAERQLTVTSNAIYTASFTNCVYTLTWNANGGNFADGSSVSNVLIAYGSPLGMLPLPDRYRFARDGWHTEESGGTVVDRDTCYTWTYDRMLYMHWKESHLYKIRTVASPEEGGTTGGDGDLATSETTTLSATPNEGYSFRSWSDGGAQTHTVMVGTSDETYTAVFTGNVYKVTFMAPEGAQPKQERFVTFGSEYGDLPTATWSKDESDMAFAGWNTDPDGEGDMIFSNTVVRTASKQTLYAMWKSIPTYHVAFDGNESTSGEMEPQKMYCGIPANLTSNMYERAGYHFRGWATNTTDAAALKIAYADGQSVTDIAPTNGTATLYAAWEEITLAEAMHCTNLVWKSADDVRTNPWTVQVGPEVGYGPSGSCVRQTVLADYSNQQRLMAELGTSGVLSFKWRGGRLKILVCEASKTDLPAESNWLTLQVQEGDEQTWKTFTTNIVSETNVVRIIRYGYEQQAAEIDQMTWTPGGPQPGPENAVTISSAAVSDGKFILSFTSDARFDYNLLTNANLLIDSWGVMTNEVGTGKAITFEPEILEDQPQLFYRVETIQRK